MADNVAITAGSGTTIAADDIGGSVLVQRVKMTWGPDGTANDADVATGKPLPVQIRTATGTAVDALTNDATHPLYTNNVTVSSASLSTLASSAISAQLLAANAARLGLILYNTDANAVLIKYGTTASASSFTYRIPPNGTWEMPGPVYAGRIDAIWEADGSGSLFATEL